MRRKLTRYYGESTKMILMIDFKTAADYILQQDNILLLCHKNPDGDTLGSAGALAFALESKGKKVAVACHNKIPHKYDYLKLPVYDGSFQPDYIVAVDVADSKLLGESLQQYADKVDLCIDHHGSNTGYAEKVCLYSHYPAAAQLMYEVINAMGAQITAHIADCLYTGIITDTGCFKFSSTTPLTHIIGAKLMELGANHTMLVEKFFMSKTKKAVQLEKYMLNNLEYYFRDKCALLGLTRETIIEIAPDPTDLDGLPSMARDFEGVQVSILIRPLREEGAYKASLRSGEEVDVSRIAKALGGGGHIRAAGCELSGTLEQVKQQILKEVEKVLCR